MYVCMSVCVCVRICGTYYVFFVVLFAVCICSSKLPYMAKQKAIYVFDVTALANAVLYNIMTVIVAV